MEVSYTLNKDDVLHVNRFVWKRALGSQIWTYRICGAIGFVIGAFGFVFYCLQPRLSGVAFMLMLAVSGAGMMWTYSEMRLRHEVQRYILRNTGVLDEHMVRISSEWFQEATSLNDTKIAWQAIQDMTADDEYLYFFTSPNAAQAIPKRAFLVSGEAEEFLATAKAYWKGDPASGNSGADSEAWPPAPQRQRRPDSWR